MKGERHEAGAPRSRCPTCGQPAAWVGNPARPFCSVSCTLIDLGRWLDGRHRIAGVPLLHPDIQAPADEP